jgi:hypothetical protein
MVNTEESEVKAALAAEAVVHAGSTGDKAEKLKVEVEAEAGESGAQTEVRTSKGKRCGGGVGDVVGSRASDRSSQFAPDTSYTFHHITSLDIPSLPYSFIPTTVNQHTALYIPSVARG